VLYFFDTSTLIKRYHREPGTEAVLELFELREVERLTCTFCWVEAVAVLDKLCQRGSITRHGWELALSHLNKDIHMETIRLIDVTRRHMMRCQPLIIQHHLAAADALILACALDLVNEHPVFVCADVRSGFLRAAEACGLSTLNPLTPSA
jgi:predicted nucleic acid-binding protein